MQESMKAQFTVTTPQRSRWMPDKPIVVLFCTIFFALPQYNSNLLAQSPSKAGSKVEKTSFNTSVDSSVTFASPNRLIALVDVGAVPAGARGSVKATIRNTTGTTFRFTDIVTHCSCIRASTAEKPYPPGANIELSIVFDVPLRAKNSIVEMPIALRNGPNIVDQLMVNFKYEIEGLLCFRETIHSVEIGVGKPSFHALIPLETSHPIDPSSLIIEIAPNDNVQSANVVRTADGPWHLDIIFNSKSSKDESMIIKISDPKSGRSDETILTVTRRKLLEVTPNSIRFVAGDGDRVVGTCLLSLNDPADQDDKHSPLVQASINGHSITVHKTRLASGVYKIKLSLTAKRLKSIVNAKHEAEPARNKFSNQTLSWEIVTSTNKRQLDSPAIFASEVIRLLNEL